MDFASLDLKIRATQAVRTQAQQIADHSRLQAKTRRAAQVAAREAAVSDFVAAFNDWQALGYTFGLAARTLEFRVINPHYATGTVGLHWEDEGRDGGLRAGKLSKQLVITVMKSSEPRERVRYHDPLERRSNEPTGILISGTIEVYSHTDPGIGSDSYPEDVFRPTVTFKRFLSQDQLDQVTDALIPMLDTLVDAINAPSLSLEPASI